MFCLQCGKELKDGAKFCGKCGWAVQAGVSPVTPPPASQSMSPPRDKLLIALIVLSAVTVVSASLMVMDLHYFFYSLARWFFSILVAIALVQGFMYRSSVLKNSAFIALLQGAQYCVTAVFYLGETARRIINIINAVWYIIFAVIFLIFAIQLFKNPAAGSAVYAPSCTALPQNNLKSKPPVVPVIIAVAVTAVIAIGIFIFIIYFIF